MSETTLQEILTGKDPFQEILYGHEVMVAVTSKKRTPRRPDCLSENSIRNELFWEAMRWCWVHEPNRRGTAEEVMDLLSSAVDDQNGTKKGRSTCCTVA
jgi:hypothetical protein